MSARYFAKPRILVIRKCGTSFLTVICLSLIYTGIGVSPSQAWFGKSSCHKTKDAVQAQDKVYLLLQKYSYQAAKAYVRNNSYANLVNFENSVITTFQAEESEYKLANSNSKCFLRQV